MIWMKKCTGLTVRWLMLKNPYAFHRAWFPTRLHLGDPAAYHFQMDYFEAIKRLLDQVPIWRDKHQWLMRGPVLLNLLGEETLQWYTTKFSTETGIFHPYFALVADVGDRTLH